MPNTPDEITNAIAELVLEELPPHAEYELLINNKLGLVLITDGQGQLLLARAFPELLNNSPSSSNSHPRAVSAGGYL